MANWSDYPISAFFEYDHLPPNMRDMPKRFYLLARVLVDELPRNAETSTALRKLLEAKECASRSMLEKLDPE